MCAGVTEDVPAGCAAYDSELDGPESQVFCLAPEECRALSAPRGRLAGLAATTGACGRAADATRPGS